MKIDLEEVESVLLEKKIEPKKVQEILRALTEIAEEVAAEPESPVVEEDGLPADPGADAGEKTKWEYVIVLNDKDGHLKDKEIAGWVVQQEENADAGLIVSKLSDAAKSQNESAKRKKNRLSSLTEIFEGLKTKFLKSKKVRIKTKELTRVIITNEKSNEKTPQDI
jgi:hypothetical protein